MDYVFGFFPFYPNLAAKNAAFFYKEFKRTQRTLCSFIKNVKERKEQKECRVFFKECKRTQRKQCSLIKNVKERKEEEEEEAECSVLFMKNAKERENILFF